MKEQKVGFLGDELVIKFYFFFYEKVDDFIIIRGSESQKKRKKRKKKVKIEWLKRKRILLVNNMGQCSQKKSEIDENPKN